MITRHAPALPSQREELLAAVGSLTIPASHHSVWIGPFDQLVSAGYAFLQAETFDYKGRVLHDYYPRVHRRIVDLLVEWSNEQPSSDESAFRDFLSGVYYNAGIQRLTFGVERMIATFAGIECTCGEPAEETPSQRKRGGIRWPDFGDYMKGADRRLQEAHLAAPLMPKLRAMLDQLRGWDGRTYDLKKGLSILREQVNQRKHGPYFRTTAKALMPVTITGESWSPQLQMELAVDAYTRACDAYCELVDWNPTAIG